MTALTDVQAWLYHLGDVSAERAKEIGATNADLVVTEWADYSRRETPYTPELIETMVDDSFVRTLTIEFTWKYA